MKKIEQLEMELKNCIKERDSLYSEVEKQRQELYFLRKEYYKTINSLSWRITVPLRLIDKVFGIVKFIFSSGNKFVANTIWYYRHFGLKASIHRALHYKAIKNEENNRQKEICDKSRDEEIWKQLEEWINGKEYKYIDIFPVAMGWNTPLFQRFQHLSLQAGNVGGISFYGGHPEVDKDLIVYKIINQNLCIFNLENQEVVNKFWEVLDRQKGLKIVRIQSIDLATTVEKIEDLLSKGYRIVYEYIDEISSQITGDIPEHVISRHNYLLNNENITVIATSDKLYSQVKSCRNNNMVMLNNGVDYNHWNIEKNSEYCPDEIRDIVESGRIIVGYHGALAQWIDYQLLHRIADDDRYFILLIGYEHDENLKNSNLLQRKNVRYLGVRSYEELNKYAIFYDVGILPFLPNDITLSVSPVKIFEYMAAGKPVVSYALPECKKYESCLCAESQEEFLLKLNKAIDLRTDNEYLNKLKKDALDNTWTSITKKMVEYVMHNDVVSLNQEEILNSSVNATTKNKYISEILQIPQTVDKLYFKELADDSYVREESDCKIIAYYLTQFHPDKHNEEWWGKGVTEWNNVSRAVPQYLGHYQPRLPGELGFYDLRIKDNMARQIELARMYGIYGFSFYYYWFDDERLLEKPLEMFLMNKDLDFPFSLCWANENWTKRFDGWNEDVLMEQPKSVASYKNVIIDMSRFLIDERYITVNEKKVITVYRPSLMPKTEKVINHWRDYCRTNGVGELYIIAVKENMVDTDWIEKGFDAMSEFHPGTLYQYCKNITSDKAFVRKDFSGEVYSYEDIVINEKYFRYESNNLYRAVMPMWDNTARRDNKGMIFHGSTPKLYKKWLKDVILETKTRNDVEDSMVFINAWNEWGEGAYLEPDKKFGYAYLAATREALEESR